MSVLKVLCGALWLTVPANAQPASLVIEPARRADDFVDAMGVCTHWGYPDTPYGFAYDQARKLLGESGFRHVRDGVHPRETDLWQSFGIQTTTIFGPRGEEKPVDQVKVLEPITDQIAMVEGPNEVDIFAGNAAYNSKVFPEGARDYQHDLYAAIKGNARLKHIGVIAPSTARSDGNLKLSPLSGFDYLVMHSYAGGAHPSTSLQNETISNLINATRVQSRGEEIKPIVVTESGYHTAINANLTLGGVQPGVSENAQAKYLPRHFAEYWNAGVRRTFIYEFLNEFPDEATNAEASFGIVRRDMTPKPAYFALKNLIGLLRESTFNTTERKWNRAPFSPRALRFRLEGNTRDIHHSLLQKANGEFYLLLWQEVSSYDRDAKKDIAVAPRALTLVLGSAMRSASLFGLQSALPLQSWNNPRSIRLNVSDEIVTLKLSPTAFQSRPISAPTKVQSIGTGTGTSIALSWPAVKGAEGYFVWRGGRYLGRTAASKYFDAVQLVPAMGFRYEIQSFNRAGDVSPRTSLVAFTKNEFPDYIVTKIEWTPALPKAGDAVTLRATLKNIGNSMAPDGVTHGVAFFVDGRFVNWSDSRNTRIKPGESVEVVANNGPQKTATWTATTGAHTITAQVDDVNRINESDETNNEGRATMQVP